MQEEVSMRDSSAPVRVVGRGGLTGTLVDPLPKNPSDRPVRIELDNGRLIQVAASLLRSQSSGTLEVDLGPEDLRIEAEPAPEQSRVIPVLAEELQVGRQAVPVGGVRVHRLTHEHEEVVDMPLTREHVDVRRVLINREVDGPLPVRREGETTVIPIVEEVLMIGKKFVLKEEVHVTRTVRKERHQERVTVRRQESAIERFDEEGRPAPVEVPTRRGPHTAARQDRTRPTRRKSILDP
jgi:uncharacterized protein (TIGR02271 family)